MHSLLNRQRPAYLCCRKLSEAQTFLVRLAQAVQQSSYYVGLQRNPGMPLMGLQLPGMQPAPMHAPVMGLQYRPAYGQGAPVQSVVSADGSTLRLRGLPYSAGVEEIADFFSGRCFGPCTTTSFVR